MKWFKNFNIISGLAHDSYRPVTFSMLDNPKFNEILTNYYAQIDLGFETIRVEKVEFDKDKDIPIDLPEDILKQLISDLDGKTLINLRSVHKVFDNNKNYLKDIEFDIRRQESSGTNKIIDLSGPIFDTLNAGGILVVDELDAKLHPLLTLSIIRLFQNQDINKEGAQLIFATHDTNILSICNLRRDQIYFVEKDKFGASELYSLVEYNKEGKVRKDRSFEKDYINGRYGAIPYFGNFNTLLEKWQEK
jgi:AAA15 family ATPase/GTPase